MDVGALMCTTESALQTRALFATTTAACRARPVNREPASLVHDDPQAVLFMPRIEGREDPSGSRKPGRRWAAMAHQAPRCVSGTARYKVNSDESEEGKRTVWLAVRLRLHCAPLIRERPLAPSEPWCPQKPNRPTEPTYPTRPVQTRRIHCQSTPSSWFFGGESCLVRSFVTTWSALRTFHPDAVGCHTCSRRPQHSVGAAKRTRRDLVWGRTRSSASLAFGVLVFDRLGVLFLGRPRVLVQHALFDQLLGGGPMCDLIVEAVGAHTLLQLRVANGQQGRRPRRQGSCARGCPLSAAPRMGLGGFLAQPSSSVAHAWIGDLREAHFFLLGLNAGGGRRSGQDVFCVSVVSGAADGPVKRPSYSRLAPPAADAAGGASQGSSVGRRRHPWWARWVSGRPLGRRPCSRRPWQRLLGSGRAAVLRCWLCSREVGLRMGCWVSSRSGGGKCRARLEWKQRRQAWFCSDLNPVG